MKKVYLIISIDTECDKDAKWRVPQPMRFDNIPEQEAVLFPVFQKYGIKPTYLLSPEVIKHEASVKFFKKHESWMELGTHMHVEFIAPDENMQATTTRDIQRNYDGETEFKKLENLTELFKSEFGFQPTSFRSGRFGSSDDTTLFLAKLGYKVDSSVTPYTTKRFENHTIDSWDKTILPYWENFDNTRILQVPLTMVNPLYDKLPGFLRKDFGNPRNFTRRIAKKLRYNIDTQWLRPLRGEVDELIKTATYAIEYFYKKYDFAILNVMFHSNEILSGASPYCQTPEDVKEFRNSLDNLFSYVAQNYDLCPIKLSELYGKYDRNS